MTPDDPRESPGASPQLEDGYFRIATETAEAFSRLQLSGNQWRLLWVILRQTYGWKRKTSQISVTYFEKRTGLKRRHVFRALTEMVDRNIVTKNDTTFVTTYGFQKDYTKWKPLPKKTLVSKLVTKPLPKLVPIKDKKKKDISVVHHSGEKVPLKDGIGEVLSLLNNKRGEIIGNGVKPITAAGEIAARLKEGRSVTDLCRVLLVKSEDPFFRENVKYYHPRTLFRKSNVDKYLDEVEVFRAKRGTDG